MISIRKGAPPLDLVRDGEKHAAELCVAYSADPDAFKRGEPTEKARRQIYASTPVKAALEACHFGKCCYCETWIPKPYAHSHVEHWRPANSSRQSLKEKRIKPGYYWLAYSWDNLFLSCFSCNSSKKNDLFPLENPEKRAKHHGMSLEDEIPSILKPDEGTDPGKHIEFILDEPFGLTPSGCKTIEVLGLKSKVHPARVEHLESVRKMRETYIKLRRSEDPNARDCAEGARRLLEQAVRPEEPYSAMVVAFLKANPLPKPAAEKVQGAGRSAPDLDASE